MHIYKAHHVAVSLSLSLFLSFFLSRLLLAQITRYVHTRAIDVLRGTGHEFRMGAQRKK
jgi:hypothetical protein